MYSAKQLAYLALGTVVPGVALACVGQGGIPAATASYSNSEPIEVAAGQSFDGGMARYDRGSGACNEQNEGGESDTVFVLRAGATLSNVIIGADQAEGVYCIGGGCTIQNVWFEDVCEDAISVVSFPFLHKKKPNFVCFSNLHLQRGVVFSVAQSRFTNNSRF
jgi:hypothetical protein